MTENIDAKYKKSIDNSNRFKQSLSLIIEISLSHIE